MNTRYEKTEDIVHIIYLHGDSNSCKKIKKIVVIFILQG